MLSIYSKLRKVILISIICVACSNEKQADNIDQPAPNPSPQEWSKPTAIQHLQWLQQQQRKRQQLLDPEVKMAQYRKINRIITKAIIFIVKVRLLL
ncbi:MAG: hypothetical protein ACI8WB_005197 [Phenylobacterium sp.]|jgi:hypothetical protein